MYKYNEVYLLLCQSVTSLEVQFSALKLNIAYVFF